MGRMRAPDYHLMKKVSGFTQKKFVYEKPGDGPDAHAAADAALARKVGETLERHYPSHPWMVEVHHAQGVVFISLPIIMKRNQRFVLHIDRLKADPGLRSVVRAGGEIMERHNVPRAGFRLDDFLVARAANPANRKVPRFIFET